MEQVINSMEIRPIILRYLDFDEVSAFHEAFCSSLSTVSIRQYKAFHKECIRDIAFWMGTQKVNGFNHMVYISPRAFSMFTFRLKWHGYAGHIPQGLHLFKTLQNLSFVNKYFGDHTVVTKLSDELCYLPKLRCLELVGVRFHKFPTVNAPSTRSLEKLIIRKNDLLTHLPQWLINTNLRNVELNECPNLIHIPFRLLEHILDRNSLAFSAYSTYLGQDVLKGKIETTDEGYFCFQQPGVTYTSIISADDFHSWLNDECDENRDHNILSVSNCFKLEQYIIRVMKDLHKLEVLYLLSFITHNAFQ